VINAHLTSLARRYPHTKFLRALSQDLEFAQGDEEDVLPTLLVYRQGDIFKNLVAFDRELTSSEGQDEDYELKSGSISRDLIEQALIRYVGRSSLWSVLQFTPMYKLNLGIYTGQTWSLTGLRSRTRGVGTRRWRLRLIETAQGQVDPIYQYPSGVFFAGPDLHSSSSYTLRLSKSWSLLK